MTIDNLNGTVVLAYSGGLDTSFCVAWLRDQGWQVITAAVNTGGFSTTELAELEQRALELGAVAHHTLDAREELFDQYIRYLIFANAKRGSVYPLSVSAERVCQAVRVARLAQHLGAQAVAHGSTAAGNDQVRFDIAFMATAPDLKLLAPIRDLGLSREDEMSFLRKYGVELDPQVEQYSVNQGMWGLTVGGAETLGSWEGLPATAYPSGSSPAMPAAQELTISFTAGVPTALDGAGMEPTALIESLNATGDAYQLGRGTHLGDTILGIKGRVGFSAPAACILIDAHRELEKLTLTARQLFWKETLGNLYGSLLHEAQHLDPLGRDLEAFLESSQTVVTGDVRLSLSMGLIKVDGCRSPYSLLSPDIAAYGEAGHAWDAADAAGFCKLYGLQQRMAQHVRSANGRGAK